MISNYKVPFKILVLFILVGSLIIIYSEKEVEASPNSCWQIYQDKMQKDCDGATPPPQGRSECISERWYGLAVCELRYFLTHEYDPSNNPPRPPGEEPQPQPVIDPCQIAQARVNECVSDYTTYYYPGIDIRQTCINLVVAGGLADACALH